MARPLRTLGGAALAIVAIVALVGIAARAQQSTPPPPPDQQGQPPPPAADAPAQPVFRAGINYVRVDAIITDKAGNAVTDLKASDFTVTEDGKPQTIDTFKLVKLDGGVLPTSDGPPRQIRNDSDEETEAARDDVRLFAIFLDDYHVRQLSSLAVRTPLTSFIETQLGPADMVSLMRPLDSVYSQRMTRDHSAIVRGIQQFVGRKYDYTPRNSLEEKYAYYPATEVEKIRNQISLSAIKGLIVHLGALKEGRKALILVSEGYTNLLPPQLRDPVAAVPGMGNPNRSNPMAGVNSTAESTATFFASQDLEDDLKNVYDTANRNNVAIYGVDPRGLAVSEFDIDQSVGAQTDSKYLASTIETIRTLSEQSDGRAIVNRNDLAVGMKQIVRDTSSYYLIGYNSTQAPVDGKFHTINVRVKRSGVEVRSRKGYWALSVEDAARATAPAKAAPPSAVDRAVQSVAQPRSRIIQTWIGTSRGANGKTRVTFVWEPTPETPGGRDGPRGEAPSRVALMAMGVDGAPYFRGRVPAEATPAPAGGASGTTGTARAPSRITFDVAPGTVQLRVSIEGASSQVLDTELRDIVVPDLTGAQTVMGTPEVLRARSVRELQQIKADPAAVPYATREFSRTDRLVIRVPVYGPGNSAPALSVHLLNRAGKTMLELPAAAGAPGVQQFELGLASLAPGEYVLEIQPAGSAADAKQLVGFRVTG